MLRRCLLRRLSPLSTPRPGEPPPRAVVLYDGACGLCTAVARRLAQWDARGRVQLESFRDPGALTRYGVDPAAAERRLQVVLPGGRTVEGITAVAEVLRAVPRLWPLWPFAAAAARLGIGARLYDAVAARRPCSARRPAGDRAPVRVPDASGRMENGGG